MAVNRLLGKVMNAAALIWGILFAVCAPVETRGASTVTLVWDASTDPTAVGYFVYYGTGTRAYTNKLDAGSATTLTISGLQAGTLYYFAATTYNATGLESDYSAETVYTTPLLTPNLPPTLAQPADVSLNENSAPQTITLTGITSGSPSETQVLTVTAISTNPTLVPSPTLQYTSPSTTAQLTIAPVANSYGSASITVMVDDGGSVSNTVIRSFTVNVLPVNNPPTLDPIPGLTVEENSGTANVPLTGISAGVGESGNVNLTVTSSNPSLIPSPTVSYARGASSGSISFAPSANAHGWSQITVTVNDGQPTNNLFSQSFVVTVHQNNNTNSTSPASWTLWWQRSDGYVAYWNMDGTNRVAGSLLNAPAVDPSWRLAAQADFNGDGKADLLWQNTSGAVGIWLMNQSNCIGHVPVPGTPTGTSWRIGGAGDLDGDGIADIIWQHTSGKVGVWFMGGTNCVRRSAVNATLAGSGWRLAGTGDFNNDGKTDLLWQYPDGRVMVWLMDGTNCQTQLVLNIPGAGTGWRVTGVADIDGAGHSNLIWQNDSTGDMAYWLMNGPDRIGLGALNPGRVDPSWRAMGPR
jgi:FG-GAP-like repeat/Bacterial Ig domain